MVRRYAVLIAAALGLAAVGGGLYLRSRAPAPKPQPAVIQAPPVDASLPGRIRAKHVVPVAAPVEGVFEELLVELGTEVYEGQLIGRIKNTSIEATREAAERDAAQAEERLNRLESEMTTVRLETSRARAEASRAQGEFERADKFYQRQLMLYREGATPRRVFEKAEADWNAARGERDTMAAAARAAEDTQQALQQRIDAARTLRDERNKELDDLKARVAAAEIHSPVTGILVGTSRQPGETVTPDIHDLVQIAVNWSELEAVVEPEPPVLALAKPGQEAMLTFADLPDAVAGKVIDVTQSEAVIEFVSPNPAIRPGMTAQVRIRF